jgi:hypothetical protein
MGDHAVTLEGSTTCQNGIVHRAEAVDVGRGGDRTSAAQRLFRGHVGGSPHDRAGLGQLDALL